MHQVVTTDAWVYARSRGTDANELRTPLERERFSFQNIGGPDVLVEPLFGSWEANMTHALEREPIDVCLKRREERVVLGNAGVVRVLKCGADVNGLREGDVCLVLGNAMTDRLGFVRRVHGYDAPGSVGLLAKRSRVLGSQLLKIPSGSRHTLRQWAAFSVRYLTAWANWHVAVGCWNSFWLPREHRVPFVCGWGGGVAFAELTLARRHNCQAAMIASQDERLAQIASSGIIPIDRRAFRYLQWHSDRYQNDVATRSRYDEDEEKFLNAVSDATGTSSVGIFVDNIGQAVWHATLNALGTPGVVTTAGWKTGMYQSSLRALECFRWHVHVHTHYIRAPEAEAAVLFAEQEGWIPPEPIVAFKWEEVPLLARQYGRQEIGSYFPVYEVNAP